MKNSSLKEMVAAFGVMVSLLFVAYEIRQNTDAIRSGTVQEIAGMTFSYTLELTQDPEWMRLMALLFEESESVENLLPVDRQRLTWGLLTSTRIMEARFRQRQLGTIVNEDIKGLGGTSNSNWYNSQMYTDWWRLSNPQSRWAPDFIQFMEEEVMVKESSTGRTSE